MNLFKRKQKQQVERRAQTPENTERRKVFDQHEKKVAAMQLVDIEGRKKRVDDRLARQQRIAEIMFPEGG